MRSLAGSGGQSWKLKNGIHAFRPGDGRTLPEYSGQGKPKTARHISPGASAHCP